MQTISAVAGSPQAMTCCSWARLAPAPPQDSGTARLNQPPARRWSDITPGKLAAGVKAGRLLRHLLAKRRQLPGPVVALRMDHDARSATARRAAFSRAIGNSARP
ncbi:Uncharacterised protein [Klebsiella pneumoniae subsp. rhinoscleromatis]|nr:Uncharacterised protein [Klebsiella pneumoniae subsp. rhinoscleromatis]